MTLKYRAMAFTMQSILCSHAEKDYEAATFWACFAREC